MSRFLVLVATLVLVVGAALGGRPAGPLAAQDATPVAQDAAPMTGGGMLRPESLAGHQFFLAYTGTTPEFRAWEGLTALLEFSADRYAVHFLTTHPEVPREHGGTWTPGPAGPTTLSWNAEEEEGLPGSWVFTFEFASSTVGTFTSGPADGAGQAPGIFLLKQ